MTLKEQFNSDKQLADWWNAVVTHSNYDKLMLYADAITLESLPSMDQRDGVIFLKHTLKHIGQPEVAQNRFPKSGFTYEPKVKVKG